MFINQSICQYKITQFCLCMDPSACYGSIDFFIINGDILLKGTSKEKDSRKWLGFLGPSCYTRYTEEVESFPFQQEPKAAPRSGL